MMSHTPRKASYVVVRGGLNESALCSDASVAGLDHPELSRMAYDSAADTLCVAQGGHVMCWSSARIEDLVSPVAGSERQGRVPVVLGIDR